MHELEFAFMLPRLEAEVTKFTSIQADKRNTYRKKVREEKKGVKEPMTPGEIQHGSGGGEPVAKRAKLDGEAEAEDEDEEGDVDETQDVEDEEVEDDEIEEEEQDAPEGMTEDLLEEKEDKDEDDEMQDGDESD
jgi:DNA polymerase epsilon subunit 3